jgi:multiple sugar transport system permease protein
LIFFVLIFALPFWYNFVFATKDVMGIFQNPPPIWFGDKLVYNMGKLIKQLPDFWMNVFNTVAVAVLSTATQIFFCTMAGFAFAKYEFKGKEIIYRFVLITLMIPPLLSIIPYFQMMVFLKWTNTYLPLFIPGMANAFGIFLMTQFIDGAVPKDLIDAARIDGLGEMQILFRVCFPLARPGLAVLGTVVFVNTWNEFIVAKVMLNIKSAYTLPVALSSLNIRADGDYGAMMIGNAISMLPLLIMFLLFSKQIISNLTAGSIKG